MQNFEATLDHESLPKLFDGLDRLGKGYYFVVAGVSSHKQATTLELRIDGGDELNDTKLVLYANGTWALKTRIPLGED